MKRSYVSQKINVIGENFRNLVTMKVAGEKDSWDPLFLAMTKLQMSIHAQFLTELINQLYESNSLLLSDTFEEEMEKLYQTLWDQCYASGDRFNYCSFSDFWNRLLEQKNIPKEEIQDYYHAKMQIFIIWKTLITLYPFGQESIVDNYILKKDKDFIDGAFYQGCSNTLLTRLIALMGSEMYIPVCHDWKNSTIPATIRPICHVSGIHEDKNELVISHGPYGEKTLGDIYEDYSTMQPLDEFALQYMVFLHVVEHDLAQSIAQLSNAYACVISTLGGETDFLGQPWEQETQGHSDLHLEQFKKIFNQLLDDNLVLSKKIFNQLLDDKLAPFKDLVSNKSNDPWENYEYKVWEQVALENKLMIRASEQPGIYIIAVRSVKDFFDVLYHELKEYTKIHVKSMDPQAWYQFKPTDLELCEALRKDESLKKYAKITFQSTRNRPY
ncbi:MAG: hypothetical protein GX313_06380 [Spirochaetales bacterium]|nr:hypothetical protein [Spirochaetales bacterium]